MDPWILVVAVVALVVASRRASGSSSASPDLRDLATQTAIDAGVDPAVFRAIITVESRWNPDAVNQGAADARRGGAWGLSQITLRTAQAYDPTITGQQLLDPVTHFRIAGQLLSDIGRRALVAEDVPALWNSGKRLDEAPDTTRYQYVPRVMREASREAGEA